MQEFYNIYTIKKDIQGIDDNGNPVFVDGTDDVYGLSTWVSFPAPSVLIKGGETKEVPVTVNVPKTVAPGGHFGGVFFSLQSPKSKNTGASVSFEIGTIVSLRIAGNVTEDARVKEFSTDRSVYGKPVVGLTLRLENLGNVLIKPHGVVDITNMLGKKVASLNVNNELAGVFPKNNRAFKLAWNPDGVAFGRYQATAALVYGENGNKTVYQAVSFWVLPLNIIVPVLGGLLAFILLFWFGMRAYVRKKIREFQGGAGARVVAVSRSAPSRLLFISLGFISFSIIFLVILFLLFS